jgi:SAM-dependent methyltransferase
MTVNQDINASYRKHVAELEQAAGTDEGLRLAIGGEFEAVGKLEYYFLRSLGLSDGHLVVDVGCGSGRLTMQLAHFPCIGYIGTDVVARLIEFTSNRAGRPDWKFHVTQGSVIPCDSGTADFTCFFSVFTHLLHEDTFRYIREASRCLKKGGLLVFSFLEFRIPSHWSAFFSAVESSSYGKHLNQFIDRDAISAWAAHSGLEVQSIHDGDKPHIPIPEVIVWEDGRRMGSLGQLGQSVAILRKA